MPEKVNPFLCLPLDPPGAQLLPTLRYLKLRRHVIFLFQGERPQLSRLVLTGQSRWASFLAAPGQVHWQGQLTAGLHFPAAQAQGLHFPASCVTRDYTSQHPVLFIIRDYTSQHPVLIGDAES